MHFPIVRLRRLRKSERIREMVQENRLAKENLVYPIFVTHGTKIKREVPSLPDVFQFSADEILWEIPKLLKKGLKSIILFGIPENKDENASSAYSEDGIIQRTIKLLKKEYPELFIITDVCLCGYTNHGHCGIVSQGEILNDETLEILAKTALSHAVAGVDMVAPSDMMDGRIRAIRQSLDSQGYFDISIMSYSAKYASAFYGPFRDAANSAPQFGNRQTYQMNPANSNEAIREIALDINEGADIIMIKPGLSYLDIVRRAKNEFNIPIAVYNVSGEYAMVKAASAKGWVDESRIVIEILLGMKRAGADLIISYHALDAIDWL